MKEIKEKNSFLLTITDYETLMNQITKKRSLRLSAEMRIFEKIMENKENREKIILILKRLLLFILIFTTFNLILFCCLLLDLSIYSSIFIIGLFELSILFCYLIKSYKKLFTDKKKILFSLEILALLISTILLKYLFEDAFNPKFYLITPFFLVYILAWCLINGNELNKKLMLSMVIRVFVLLQLGQFLLKLDRKIDWDWNLVFWPLWTWISIFFLYGFLIKIVILTNFRLFLDKNKCFFQGKGLIFTDIFIMKISGFLLGITLGIKDYYETKNINIILISLAFFIAMSIIILLYMKIMIKSLKIYLISIFFEQEFQSEIALEQKSEGNQIPQYLYKFSSTFYKVINSEKISNLNEIENTNTQSQNSICLICLERNSNAVLANCGHSGLCFECALNLMKSNGNCFLCRNKINKILKINDLIGNMKNVIAVADYNNQI